MVPWCVRDERWADCVAFFNFFGEFLFLNNSRQVFILGSCPQLFCCCPVLELRHRTDKFFQSSIAQRLVTLYELGLENMNLAELLAHINTIYRLVVMAIANAIVHGALLQAIVILKKPS